MPRPRILAALLALLASCGSPGADDTTASDSDESSAASSVPTGGHACNSDIDCPTPGACEQVACEDSLCVTTPRPAGEVVDDTPGNCQTLVCDADGQPLLKSEPTDLPDDGLACTDDLCDDGDPVHVPRPPGSTCDANFVCHTDLTCQPCPEYDGCSDDSPAEPNETQGQAHPLPAARDDADPAHLCEALGTPNDVDWFTFTTVDTNLGTVAPAIVAPADGPRICMFFQCAAGGTNVACPSGTEPTAAPLGQQGCCARGSFAPTIDCNGFTEDATVWLQVHHDEANTAPACQRYQLAYEF